MVYLLNKGRLLNGVESIIPATPLGVITLLKAYELI